MRTAGVGLIRNGELVWTGYFGDQAPGVRASRTTQFDLGSITKPVAAETVLRLAGDGRISLDEPMGALWIDPDLVGDNRVYELTPRMILTHTSGFPNWRNHLDDGKLAFINAPGEAFGYSGEGFEYLARFVEAKLGRPFPELVEAEVLGPANARDAAFAFKAENLPNVARLVDDETGEWNTRWQYHCLPIQNRCREDGEYSAASDMAASVEALASFLIFAMQGNGLDQAMLEDRNRV